MEDVLDVGSMAIVVVDQQLLYRHELPAGTTRMRPLRTLGVWQVSV